MSATIERPTDRPTDATREPGNPNRRGGRRAPGAAGRGRFWLGFALGFALLTIASCSGVALTLGLGRLSLDELRGNGTAWTPPTLMPTPAAPLLVEGAASDVSGGGGRFEAGTLARNITGTRVNVRRTPGHLGKAANDVLIQIEPGEQVEILGDTTQADNLTWYRVLFSGVDGWVAESTASGVQILGE